MGRLGVDSLPLKGSLLSGGGGWGLRLWGFISGHKVLTLPSGDHLFGGSLLSEI